MKDIKVYGPGDDNYGQDVKAAFDAQLHQSEDVFRTEHRELNATEKGFIERIKRDAQTLLNSIDMAAEWSHDCALDEGQQTRDNGGREYSIARTRLEECVMWAVKGVTK
jgi:hypothetical protein